MWLSESAPPRRRRPGVFQPGGDTPGPRLRGDDVHRRGLLAALVACVLLASCGFQLRGQASYPFRTFYVNAPAYGPFATELRRAIAGAGTAAIAESASGAEVVIDVTEVADDKQVLSLSPGGRVQEYALAKAVRFRVHDAQGREWMKPDEIVIRRNYTYDDTERLAREIQEARLLRDMQTDAVAQIVRRLQLARPPA